jgi:hypothetical protein
MSSLPGPVTNVVVVNFDAGSPKWSRPERPDGRHRHADRAAQWDKNRGIPRPHEPDPALIDRLRRAARETIAEHKSVIEAALRPGAVLPGGLMATRSEHIAALMEPPPAAPTS